MNDLSIMERFGADPHATIGANLHEIRRRIAAACERAGRRLDEVRLLPVSKTVPETVIREAVRHGLTFLGENKVQEARLKAEGMSDLPIRWSIIGHLQANKAKYVARFATEFQALDSVKIAQALEERLEIEGRTLDVLVQVNTSGETTKFGLSPEAVLPLLNALPDYPRLRVRGLMTLALFSDDKEAVRRCFVKLRGLRDRLRGEAPEGIALDELSMGMSGDYEIAIEEGATIVRVGQALFGKRPGSDAHYWPGLIPGN
ncbi:MAG TPA: YggS family pyridoxal phosphate-dependent enzyme [Chthoniobacteraceae bacterium]|nr:YggS family pyridoxal phosphate-dependent enzyme [Chthoniobacteraceae bacterium]